MKFETEKSIAILERMPQVLRSMLAGLPEDWIQNNEGPETWSPYDIVGHLIHGEKTDWIPRLEIILSDRAEKIFEPFDRFAQLHESKGKSLETLLAEFEALRAESISCLRSHAITESDLGKEGIHPVFGKVTLSQLLSTWVVHDLGHVAQISRVMAKQYKTEVGPWIQYLPVLTR